MKKIFTLLTVVLIASWCWGDTDVQIGSGTATSAVVPSNFKSEYSVVELLYPISMLSGLKNGDVITHIQFNLKQNATFTRKWKVYMSFNSSYNSTGSTMDAATNLVYDGDVSMKQGWFDVKLTNSFTYSPTSSTKALQIIIYDYTGSSASLFERSCYVTATTNNQSAYKNGSSAMTPTSSISGASAVEYLPNTLFTIVGSAAEPSLSVDESAVNFGTFDKTTETKSAEITITGENLTADVTISADAGLSVEPASLTKEAVMATGGAKVTISSTADFVSGSKVTISSTGATAKTVTCSGVQGITIDDSKDNSALLAANDGDAVNIAFKRSFTKDMYNTICLPIELSDGVLTSTFGGGYSLIELKSTSKDGDAIVLTFDTKTTLAAGVPYLIKPTKDVVNPSFTNYVVSKDLTTKETTYIDFIPVFSPTALEQSKNILFLGAGNELFWPTEAGSIKGLRCYFQVKNGVTAGAPMRIVTKPNAPTQMDEVQAQATAQKVLVNGQLLILRDGVYYTVNGQVVK